MKSNEIIKKKFAIVFDWDGVIFNTNLLKKVRARALKKLGYSEEVANVTAQAVIESGGYTPLRHAKVIAQSKALDPEKIARLIYRAIEEHPSDFVFPDAQRTLQALDQERRVIDILTSGEKKFQEYKIERSKLKRLFRNVHTVRAGKDVPALKLQVLKKLARAHDTLIFLDDRPDTIELVYRAPALKGKVLPILVWRHKEKPPAKLPAGLPVVRRLVWRQLQKIAICKGLEAY